MTKDDGRWTMAVRDWPELGVAGGYEGRGLVESGDRRSTRVYQDRPVPRKALKGIVEARSMLASMITGYPRVSFQWGIQRALAGVT